MIKLYACRGMTGRVKEDVVKEATADREWLTKAGFTVLCPVEKENVPATQQVLMASKKALEKYWPEDKRMIREANIIFDLTPHLNSEGSKHEIGYGRYCLWKPVVRVFPNGKLPPPSSVARFEDDFICDSLEEAIEYSLRVHGTWFKRFNWRLRMINRCLPKWLLHQILEWK